ncbi:MAG: multiprotein bridging factor aMBF1 [Nitrososphaerales archaeon]
MPDVCEVCGNVIYGKKFQVNIDGALMNVCSSCSKLGKPVTVTTKLPFKAQKIPLVKMDDSFSDLGSLVLRKEYPVIIKRARERLGISQEDLGLKIKEKSSVIKLLETGKLEPDYNLAKKLERFLKVQLYEELEDELK